MGKFKYSPNHIFSCMYAYWYAKKFGEDTIEPDDEAAMPATFDKEFFLEEDGSCCELVSIMFDQQNTPVFWYLIEGINLTEFDPSTPGGKMLWEHLFNSENLTKKALEEGQAIGKWDTLRQVINMGQIAYMTKVNVAIAYLKHGFTEERENLIAALLDKEYVNAARDILSRDKEEPKSE